MTAALADAELAELEALHKAATPGPWRAMREGNAPLLDGTLVGQSALQPVPRPYNPSWVGYADEASGHLRHHTTVMRDEDADFIARARTVIPALLAEVREHRKRLAGPRLDCPGVKGIPIDHLFIARGRTPPTCARCGIPEAEYLETIKAGEAG